MITQNFILNAKLTLSVQKTRISASNRIYSHQVESIIRGHPSYPQLLAMRKNKSADRKETAAYMKKLLKESLGSMNLSEEIFTKSFEDAKAQNTVYQLLLQAEEEGFKNLLPELKTIPIYNWLHDVKGLGIRYSVKLIYNIRDATRFPNPSKLRKYCGTVPGQRFIAGQEAHFSPELKSILLGQIPGNFLKANSQYKQIYDAKKSYYTQLHIADLAITEQKKANKQKLTKEDWTKMKIHHYAIKAMMNRFICDLWVCWWLSEGKTPPANIYIANDPKHTIEPPVVAYKQPLSF